MNIINIFRKLKKTSKKQIKHNIKFAPMKIIIQFVLKNFKVKIYYLRVLQILVTLIVLGKKEQKSSIVNSSKSLHEYDND